MQWVCFFLLLNCLLNRPKARVNSFCTKNGHISEWFLWLNLKMGLKILNKILIKYFLFTNSIFTTGDSLSLILSFDSICAVIDQSDLNSKKSIELLYEQWRVLASVLYSSILSACNQSNYIKQTFQNEYPKLLKLQNDVWLRLLQLNPLIDRYRYTSTALDTNKSSKQQSQQQPLAYLSSYELLRKCFYDLENSYLNRSLSHLFDPINLIFSQNSDKPINRADVDTYLKGVQSQLQTLQHDIFNSTSAVSSALVALKTSNLNVTLSGCSSAFSDKIVANICKSIQMYANKSEQVLNSLNAEFQQSMSNFSSSNNASAGNTNSGGGVSNNSGIFAFTSQVQTKNLDYVNSTHDLFEQMTRMFANEKLSKKLEDKLNVALKTLLVFEENALKPFIVAGNSFGVFASRPHIEFLGLFLWISENLVFKTGYEIPYYKKSVCDLVPGIN